MRAVQEHSVALGGVQVVDRHPTTLTGSNGSSSRTGGE